MVENPDGQNIVTNPTSKQPGFDLSRQIWVTLNRIRTGHGRCNHMMFKWKLHNTSSCVCENDKQTISHITTECRPVPATTDDRKNIEYGFRTRWNFPGCVGALDSKHIINIGAKGKGSDECIFQNSTSCNALETNSLAIPKDFVILADYALPLKKYLMESYSRCNMSQAERIYNYRVSRGRRVVENAFGILLSKFRLFEKPISLKLETLDNVVIVCYAIHNWLKKTNPRYVIGDLIDYEDKDNRVFPGSWRQYTNVLQNIPLLYI
ncbi:Harbinger transposase-derived nuclease domain [Cinara cedri]|uniref:Harbinger transposase-derived nuclease domain n=1 Tax=Cinara cedri TaxID=506608 RepID=A0A5E4N873_9HEMI|nr:Harbinger transposase-derived nuclease domain [Cinara cedri]